MSVVVRACICVKMLAPKNILIAVPCFSSSNISPITPAAITPEQPKAWINLQKRKGRNDEDAATPKLPIQKMGIPER
jgi:hypothetical protein